MINCSSLKWLNSYILNKSAYVKLCDFTYDPLPLLYGVPKVYVLCVHLSFIYITPIRSNHPNFLVFIIIYADDIQLISFLPISSPNNTNYFCVPPLL